MKALTHIVLVAVVLAASSLCMAAGSIGDAVDFDLGAKRLCRYEAMVAELALTAEQTAKIQLILGDMDAALVKWGKTNALQLSSLRQDEAECRKTGDTATLLRTLNQFMALKAERRRLAEPFLKRIGGVLTAEQQAKWEGYVLSSKLTVRFANVGLADDQKTQIRALCDGRGGEIFALRGRDDRRAVARAEREINKEVIDSVLTESQRVKLRGNRSAPSGPATADREPAKLDEKRDGGKKAADGQKKKSGKDKNQSDDARRREQEARKRMVAEQDRRRREDRNRRREYEERRRRERDWTRRRLNYLRRQEYERRRAAEKNKSSDTTKKPSSSKKPPGRNMTGTPRKVGPTSHTYRPR